MGSDQKKRPRVENENIKFIFKGNIVYAKSHHELVTIEDGILGINKTGQILFVGENKELDEFRKTFAVEDAEIIALKKNQLLIPGLIDTHIHAPQYVYTGTGYDKPLLEWLNTYTFPREAEFKDAKYASSSYKKVVKRSLYCGTTTACYYGTIHLEACKILTDTVNQVGQRAYIGKVNMDRNSPDYYIETTEKSKKDTETFVNYVQKKVKNPLITPIITPRFVPSCTSELMSFLGTLAEKHNLPIQSHISENKAEIEWVKSLHPDCKSYSHVYEKYKLLNDRTVMAHCIHLSDEERKLFKDLNVGVSHCPNSNFSLQSGVCNVKRLFQEGLTKIGLGTDVGGGYSPCILDSIRQAATASKMTGFIDQSGKLNPLTLPELFYLGTLGGAKVLNLDHKVGSFEHGKDFDALIVSVDLEYESDDGRKNIHLFKQDNLLSRLEKFVYLGDDRNIEQVYVAGKQVK